MNKCCQKKRLAPNIIALHHFLTILWFRELSFKRCISISCRRQEGATRRALHWWVGGTFSTNFGKRTIEGKVLPSKAGGGQAYIDLQGAHYLALKLRNVASSQISQQFLRDDNFTFTFFSVQKPKKAARRLPLSFYKALVKTSMIYRKCSIFILI